MPSDDLRRSAAPIGAAPIGAVPRRVLVVDADADARVILERILRLDGFDVRVDDGARGIEAAVAGWRPDLAIVALGRHPGDGLDRVRALRGAAVGCEGPIVGVMTVCYADTQEQALAAGCTVTLFKPIDLVELRATLTRLLRS